MKSGETRSPVHFLIVRLFAVYAAILLCILSCEDPDPVTPVGPTMEFLPAHTPFITSNDTIPKEIPIAVHMSCTKGSGDLKELILLENGILVDTLRIDILNAQGHLPITNPFSIPSTDQDHFEYAVFISTQHSGLYEYTYTLRDANDLEFSKKIVMLIHDVLPELTYSFFPQDAHVGSWFYLDLHAKRGTANFELLEIYENGILFSDSSRLYFNQFPIASNPLMLTITNTSQTFHISINLINQGLQTYLFKVRDQDNYTAEISLSIMVN